MPLLSKELHDTAVLILVGVMWTVQLIQYPAFFDIDPTRWHSFHLRHARCLVAIAFPLMVADLATSVALISKQSNGLHMAYLAGALLTWILTITIFVPLHRAVSLRPDRKKLRQIMTFNWLRTLTWTAVGCLILISRVNPL